MTPPRRRLRIDWVAVEEARLARGLTHPELAARVGATAPYASYRLWLDDDHDNIRLGVLECLCEVLDLEPAELFTPRPRRSRRSPRHTPSGTAAAIAAEHRPASAQDPETATMAAATASTTGHNAVAAASHDALAGHDAAATAVEADVATAGAAIAALSAPVTRDQLADALGWPLGRLLAATALLEDHLEASGSRVHTDDHGVHGLEPRHGLLNGKQRQALHQAGVATTTEV